MKSSMTNGTYGVAIAKIAQSPISGALEKIAALRIRHKQLVSSIHTHETNVARQTAQLDRMNRSAELDDNDLDEDEEAPEEAAPFTEEDMRREEEEIKELEKKKEGLEDRVTGMEKDLGGLMR